MSLSRSTKAAPWVQPTSRTCMAPPTRAKRLLPSLWYSSLPSTKRHIRAITSSENTPGGRFSKIRLPALEYMLLA